MQFNMQLKEHVHQKEQDVPANPCSIDGENIGAMEMPDNFQSGSNHIQVIVRFRPLNEAEKLENDETIWSFSPQTVSATHRNDRVFGANVSDNNEIFETVSKNLVDSTIAGFNGTIFAYGQTSAGKTFTMKGENRNPGIIPRAISHMFAQIRSCRDRDFGVRCSYLEIYNENITDLLQAKNTNLKIHESLYSGIFVGNLTEEPVSSAEEALFLFSKGEERRHVGTTNMNERSSRSHTIFRMIIESREVLSGVDSRESCSGPLRISILNFVDLAGSERISSTGAEGNRLKEGGHINKSLLALTTVISRLSDGNDKSHIPYRDSKLTRILQPSLGGNARTTIICALTPAVAHLEESLSTLKFASRAKKIKNRAHVNEFISDEEQIRRYCAEISRLKELLTYGSHPEKKSKTLSHFLTPVKMTYRLIRAIQNYVPQCFSEATIQPLINDLHEEVSFLELESRNCLELFEKEHHRLEEKKAEAKCLEANFKDALGQIDRTSGLRQRFEDLLDAINVIREEMSSVESAYQSDLDLLHHQISANQLSLEKLETLARGSNCTACLSLSQQIFQLSETLDHFESIISSVPKVNETDLLEITFQKKVDQLQEEKEQLEGQIQALHSEIFKRETDISSLMDSYAVSQRNERQLDAKYQAQIDSLILEKEVLEQKTASLNSELTESANAISEYKGLYERSLLNIQALKSDVADQSLKLSELTEKLSLVQEIADGKTRECVSASALISDSNRQISELEYERSQNKNSLELFHAQLAEKSNLIDSLHQKLKSQMMIIMTKDANIQQLKDENSDFLKTIVRLQEETKGLALEMKNVGTRTADLELINAARAELHGCREELALVSAQKNKLERSLQEKEDLFAKLEVKSLKLEASLGHKNAEYEAVFEKVARSENTIYDLLSDMKRKDEIILEHSSQLAELRQVIISREKQEILLRVELEKNKESFLKERRQYQLRLSELEEQFENSKGTELVPLDKCSRISELEAQVRNLQMQHRKDVDKLHHYSRLSTQGICAENVAPISNNEAVDKAGDHDNVNECKQQ